MNLPIITFFANRLQNSTSLPTLTKPAEQSNRTKAIHAVALGTFLLTFWQVIRGNPWSAIKIGMSGICLNFCFSKYLAK